MTWMRAPARNSLSGRTALVTGGSGAFGSATLKVLRHMGADAVGLDLLPAEGVLPCDVTDDDQAGKAVGGAIERFGGRLDTLVHYAGVGPAVDIGNPPDAQVHEALEVNLLGAWRVTAAALPALVRSNGRVIITASLLAFVTMPFAGAYTVAKRGLTAYADVLRAEYGTHISVTTVYPGYVDTPIHDRSRAAGVALDGLVPAERVRDTVMTVIRAATAARPPRDVASTPLGNAALRIARHAPGLTDRVTSAGLGRLVHSGHFADSPLAAGLRNRHKETP